MKKEHLLKEPFAAALQSILKKIIQHVTIFHTHLWNF